MSNQEEQGAQTSPKPKRKTATHRKLTDRERHLLQGFGILGSVCLGGSRFFYPSHMPATIWMLFASALLYDIAAWIFLKSILKQRTPLAIGVAVLAFLGFGVWASRSNTGTPEQSAPRIHIEQKTGDGGANTVGDRNQVNTNPPKKAKEESKK